MIPAEKKLAVIERLIEAMRWVRDQPEHPEHATYTALKSIAADIRGSMPTTVGQARRQLQQRIDAVRASKTRLGYSNNLLIALAEELLGRWPAVCQALERYENVPDDVGRVAADWFTLPPSLRTKANLIAMLRGEIIDEARVG